MRSIEANMTHTRIHNLDSLGIISEYLMYSTRDSNSMWEHNMNSIIIKRWEVSLHSFCYIFSRFSIGKPLMSWCKYPLVYISIYRLPYHISHIDFSEILMRGNNFAINSFQILEGIFESLSSSIRIRAMQVYSPLSRIQKWTNTMWEFLS